jgi:hypothetical protein
MNPADPPVDCDAAAGLQRLTPRRIIDDGPGLSHYRGPAAAGGPEDFGGVRALTELET